MGKHTPGAVNAARIIINGKELLSTRYGRKTAEGLADMIDRETHAPELLDMLRMVSNRLEIEHKHVPSGIYMLAAFREEIAALVKKAEGK